MVAATAGDDSPSDPLWDGRLARRETLAPAPDARLDARDLGENQIMWRYKQTS
jgi:hypothetical protein